MQMIHDRGFHGWNTAVGQVWEFLQLVVSQLDTYERVGRKRGLDGEDLERFLDDAPVPTWPRE